MVLTKEYRICMPITVEEYHRGQLYMIARHSLEQSGDGEGVEVVENKPCVSPKHGNGQFTEKRIYLSSRLPYWLQAIVPKIFYVTEKAWNYYPYTITEYTCSFIPKFQIQILTTYEDNNGSSENSLNLTPEQLAERIVDHIDIAYDDLNPKYYKEEEDLTFFQSKKTQRGPLVEGWRAKHEPIMCAYKLVNASFEVFGFQTKVEEFIHSCTRQVLLLGHKQAFAWIDDWIDMPMSEIRKYEAKLQSQTNTLVSAKPEVPLSLDSSISPAASPKSPEKKGYFSWF